jgi:hypothetical protein
VQGVAFLAATGQPNVVVGHVGPEAGGERLAARGDELLGLVELTGQLAAVGLVGGELGDRSGRLI